ncbi:MAG: sulfotransferase [Pseudomonadota bacterium]
MVSHRPILVTGCPRSGTTWTGNVIGASREVFNIYEPFNDDVGARLDLPERFMRITPGNADSVKAEIDALMSLGNFKDRALLAVQGTAERVLPASKRYTPARLAARRLLRHRQDFINPRRVSIKDPIAFYSSEWIADTYDAQVVILIRHPCGVVGSYLSLGWDSELPEMIKHPVAEGYSSLCKEIAHRRADQPDQLGDLILQWKLFTAATLELSERRSDWIFVLHDELCLQPEDHFRALFKQLDLAFTPEIAEKIKVETSNAAEPKSSVQHQHNRDSRALVDAWQEKLPQEDANRILVDTADLWAQAKERFSLQKGMVS